MRSINFKRQFSEMEHELSLSEGDNNDLMWLRFALDCGLLDNDLPTTFEERQKYINKFNVEATLFIDDNGEQKVSVKCNYGEGALSLLDTTNPLCVWGK